MKNFTAIFLVAFLIIFSNCSNSIIEPAEEEKMIEEETTEETPVDTKHPNILLIIADDMSLDATPNYAGELNAIKPVMPTLENLMSTGLVFDNLWSYALCSPTRASILTGKHGLHTNVLVPIRGLLSGSHTSLQSYINEETSNAYANAVFGKWHLGYNVTHPTQTMGIDTYAGNLGGAVPDYWSYDLVENEQESLLTSSTAAEKKENYSTTKYTQLAIDWKNQQTKPWFLWVAYNAAHTPFHRPDNELISTVSQAKGETDLNNYLAMLEAMDSEMGRLIASMSEAEKANTVIIFIGDNGTPKKVAQYIDKNKHRKGSIYQGGINVPMVISGTGTRVGRESEALVHTVDLFATIAEIAGVDVQKTHNSQSFKALLENEDAETREYVYTEVPGDKDNGHYAVRNNKYKLIYEIDSGTKELYNLLEDRYEETNILSSLALSDEETAALSDLEAEGKRVRGE
jgi:arylsulfatase A-like enzyme